MSENKGHIAYDHFWFYILLFWHPLLVTLTTLMKFRCYISIELCETTLRLHLNLCMLIKISLEVCTNKEFCKDTVCTASAWYGTHQSILHSTSVGESLSFYCLLFPLQSIMLSSHFLSLCLLTLDTSHETNNTMEKVSGWTPHSYYKVANHN